MTNCMVNWLRCNDLDLYFTKLYIALYCSKSCFLDLIRIFLRLSFKFTSLRINKMFCSLERKPVYRFWNTFCLSCKSLCFDQMIEKISQEVKITFSYSLSFNVRELLLFTQQSAFSILRYKLS